jgi:hypothetical protein
MALISAAMNIFFKESYIMVQIYIQNYEIYHIVSACFLIIRICSKGRHSATSVGD